MKLSRIATIATATFSSAASFYVLTRSGLAGTLVGAAVAGTVYNLTSQGLTHGIDAGRHWLSRRRDMEGMDAEVTKPDHAGATERADGTPAVVSAERTTHALGLVARWAPAALGLVAVGLSVSALVTPDPVQQVVKERVVAQPVIQERIVVQEHTVTVTVPVAVISTGTGDGAAGGGTTTSSSAQVTATTHASTTATSVPVTSTTEPPLPSTTTLPPATQPTDGSAEGTNTEAAN